MHTAQNEIVQLNEVLVFGAAALAVDTTSYKCETDMDDLTCSVTHTKTKD